MKKGDILEVEIIKQDHFGNGIAKVENFIIFVNKALPGDKVKIKIISINKNFAKAEIIKLISKSDMRVKPICEFYDVCGGCHIMHEKYEEQLKFKQAKVNELLTRNFKSDIKINEIVYDKDLNYRNKVTLHVEKGHIGYYQSKSNNLVVIDKCELVHPLINKYIGKIKKLLTTENCEIIIRISFASEEVLISIKGEFKNIDKLKEEDISLYYNNELINGKGFITERINDMSFRINHKSFFQVNPAVASKLYCKIVELSKNHHKVLDLYCGVGGIGLLVSKYVDQVTGIEIIEEAIKEANINKELNKIDNTDFIVGDVKDKINSLKDVDLIIVDPPREGLNQEVVNDILEISPKGIIYVSCDINTLIRDIKLLEKDYEIENVNIFDMFPNTYHVEAVTRLVKE